MSSPSHEQPADRLAAERTAYRTGRLADEATTDPLTLFDAWMTEAFERRETHGDLTEPTAVVFSTISTDGQGRARPRSRTVLLKGRDARGFVIYTNLDSDKGRELAACPSASLLLPVWMVL